jgi:hypothetical protein
MAAKQVVVKLEPFQEGKYPGVFTATVMDPGLKPGWPDVPISGGGEGIWGPTDPRPTPPIALPGLPGWGEPPGGGSETPPTVATVVPMPGEPKPKPEGLPEGSANVLLVFPGQGYACEAWTLPYIDHRPKT